MKNKINRKPKHVVIIQKPISNARKFIDTPNGRICGSCKVEKPLSDYSNREGQKIGTCNACINERQKVIREAKKAERDKYSF